MRRIDNVFRVAFQMIQLYLARSFVILPKIQLIFDRQQTLINKRGQLLSSLRIQKSRKTDRLQYK